MVEFDLGQGQKALAGNRSALQAVSIYLKEGAAYMRARAHASLKSGAYKTHPLGSAGTLYRLASHRTHISQ